MTTTSILYAYTCKYIHTHIYICTHTHIDHYIHIFIHTPILLFMENMGYCKLTCILLEKVNEKALQI